MNCPSENSACQSKQHPVIATARRHPRCGLFLFYLASALLLISSFPAAANAQTPLSTEALHSRIMQASGFDQALADIWLSIEQSITETQVDSQQRAELHRLLSQSFSTSVLLEGFHAGLYAALETEPAQKVVDFLDSPTGQHILQTEAEQVNATEQELLDFSENFDPNSGQNRQRVALTREILAGTRTFDNTVLILHSIYSNVMLAVQAVNAPEGRRMSEEDFTYTSGLIRTQLENQMNEYVLLNMLFTYRDTDISYLESYAAHLSSPAGLWYTQTLHHILADVLENAGNRLKAEVYQRTE